MDIGNSLKKIRSEKKYTLKEVADKLGLSASLLSQIENGKITPSLQTLGDLLKFYAINFSDFFKQVEQKKYIFIKKDEAEMLNNIDLGFKLNLLASKLQNNTLESYIVEMNIGAAVSLAKFNPDANSERIIYIISGGIKAILDDNEAFSMTEGDSLNFKSYVHCSIKNDIYEYSKFIVSGAPPIFL